jgi:hypothetical protein
MPAERRPEASDFQAGGGDGVAANTIVPGIRSLALPSVANQKRCGGPSRW